MSLFFLLKSKLVSSERGIEGKELAHGGKKINSSGKLVKQICQGGGKQTYKNCI